MKYSTGKWWYKIHKWYWNKKKESWQDIEEDTIMQLIDSLEDIESYYDFIGIRKKINGYINSLFKSKLTRKDQNFINAFNQKDMAVLKNDNKKQKLEFMQLLKQKNNLYLSVFLSLLEYWKLNKILKTEDIQDMIILINSGLIQFFDEVFIQWYENFNKIENDENHLEDNSYWICYWWVKNWKIVWYNEFCKDMFYSLNLEVFEFINNSNLKEYLTKFTKLIEKWVTNYIEWINLEEFEIESWKWKWNEIWIIWPMESYFYPNLLIEPELMFFIKDHSKIDDKQYPILSKKYFWDSYNMWMNSFNFVEPFLEAGKSSFFSFVWKSFPNDNELSKKTWKAIVVKNEKIREHIENKIEILDNMFIEWINFDAYILYNEMIKEVWYHEFGHSLFKSSWISTNLEELKSSLFYYLKLYDENKEKPYNEEKITNVIKFIFMDSVRTLEMINKKNKQKYVILTKVILFFLFSSQVVYWKGDLLDIDPNIDKFKDFLEGLKKILLTFQKLYSAWNKMLEEFNKQYITIISEKVNEDMQKIIAKM